jgi:hypothetical protein
MSQLDTFINDSNKNISHYWGLEDIVIVKSDDFYFPFVKEKQIGTRGLKTMTEALLLAIGWIHLGPAFNFNFVLFATRMLGINNE